MKKAVAMLVLGLLAAGGGYSAFYFFGTASSRELLHEQSQELAWLKREFNLSDAEYARITELHAAYLPACQERCSRIAAKDAELRDLLKTNTFTPAIEEKLAEVA